MDWGAIFVLAVVAALVLIAMVINWWASRRHPYNARELKYVRKSIEEEASRSRPPWADDPIAKSIEWTGTSAWKESPGGGALRIRSVTSARIEFQPKSALAWHVSMLFLGMAGGILIYFETNSVTSAFLPLLMFMGLSFVVWLVRQLSGESLVFDKHLGMYWEGKRRPTPIIESASSKRHGQISDIYALQLVGTYRWVANPQKEGASFSRAFNTYELNLVMKDGTRHSMVLLDDYNSLKGDAKVLAAFLERPLWESR